MPEKQVWFDLIVAPLLGWMGYLQTNKLSKSNFKTYIDEHAKVHQTHCEKLDAMHDDLREVRGLLLQHMSGERVTDE